MIIYEDILRAFQRQKVKYIITGGIAVNLLGSLRTTADLDILVEMSDSNLAKAVSILKKKGYRIKQPIDPIGIADKKTREDWIRNKHLKAMNFYKAGGALKEVDIIIDSPVSYTKAQASKVTIKSDDIALPVISIDNLIVMKKKAARESDTADIKELQRIKKIQKARR
ncbi:nucleotidyltransferase domain-containing protein [Candidatus Omnitrophota bacterium]